MNFFIDIGTAFSISEIPKPEKNIKNIIAQILFLTVILFSMSFWGRDSFAEPLAYVTHYSSSQKLSILDLANKTVVKTIDVGVVGLDIVITPDAALAYVGNIDKIAIIDLYCSEVFDTEMVGGDDLAVTPDGSQLFAGNNVGKSTIALSDSVTKNINE